MTKNRHVVLIAEDDQNDVFIIKDAFERWNGDLDLYFVGQRKEVFDFLKSPLRPSIIFMDINLPGVKGDQILRDIKANKQYDDIPIVMISTSNRIEDVEESMRGGASGYIVKSVDFDTFNSDLHEVLEELLE